MKFANHAWLSYGGLGPDIDRADTLVKRELGRRVKDFSEQVRLNHRSCVLSDINRSHARIDVPSKPVSNRTRAIEFAKRIPKPPIRAHPAVVVSSSRDSADCLAPRGRLHLLLQRHAELARQVADIRSCISFE